MLLFLSDENKSKVSTQITTSRLTFMQEQLKLGHIVSYLNIWTIKIDIQIKLVEGVILMYKLDHCLN